MALSIEQSIASKLPTSVKVPLAKMKDEEQALFADEYKRKRKSLGFMYFLAILLPGFQFFSFKHASLFWLFHLTFWGFGIWYIIELFLTPRRTRNFNEDLAVQILRDQKMMA
ncbi:MAG: hypothetical protein P8P30_03840 [Rickettsiales bacterium]|nr:hypothetical protein [Rickettsiales bacterium]